MILEGYLPITEESSHQYPSNLKSLRENYGKILRELSTPSIAQITDEIIKPKSEENEIK
ncbi:12568_t:CDS:2 [Funneliformis caledonium]|uniref:12568_t:CDS:1 n=1 Tax=Funneliformis caledonium TaxID=1117310 RepID=A0A9N8ZT21_9GLOM|nr:12568_t:CDS:2 [Funneliformis caledonium]